MSRVSCLETPEIGTSLVFIRSESLQLPGWRMGRKRVAVWERVHQQVLQLPTRPALALPGTNSALVEISTTFFFFPSVNFGGTCGSLQQGPRLGSWQRLQWSTFAYALRSLLQGSAQAERGRDAVLLCYSQGWGNSWFSCRKKKLKKNPLIDSPLASTFPSVIQPDKDPDVRWPHIGQIASAAPWVVTDPTVLWHLLEVTTWWQKPAEGNMFPHLSQKNTSSSQSGFAYPCRLLKLCTEMAENMQVSVTHFLTHW